MIMMMMMMMMMIMNGQALWLVRVSLGRQSEVWTQKIGVTAETERDRERASDLAVDAWH